MFSLNHLGERLADRLVLCPSKDPIDPGERCRHLIPFEQGNLEAWSTAVFQETDSPRLIGLKFPGTSGRAERAGAHPCELWSDVASEVWTINPAGYGGSDGTASLFTLAAQCDAVFNFVRAQFPAHKILLIGNSIGCLSALYLAARHDVDGIYLRNPPPLADLIRSRPKYNWWNFGMARLVAQRIPAELDTVKNASNTNCPLFFLRSEKDRVVPDAYQKLIWDAFAGPKQEFVIPDADHEHPVGEDDAERYLDAILNFKQMVMR